MSANNELILGDQPKQVKCPYCSNSTVSTVAFKNGYISYITCFLILLIFGLMPSLILIPVVMIITRTLVHKCSACNEEIGGDGKVFHILGIKDSMMSFKFGEFGMIVTKRIVIGIVLLIFTLGMLWYRIVNIPTQQWTEYHTHTTPNITIGDTWSEYLQTCSKERIFTARQQYYQCESKYIDRTVVDWKGKYQKYILGYAIRVEDNQQSLMKFLHHSVNILVKMDPAESEFHPDLLLTADSEVAQLLSPEIEKLERGSEFIFTAVIKSIGDLQNLRHLHLVNITKSDGYIEIPPHLHQQGRYGGSQQFLAKSTE